jgi:hypothetical protein
MQNGGNTAYFFVTNRFMARLPSRSRCNSSQPMRRSSLIDCQAADQPSITSSLGNELPFLGSMFFPSASPDASGFVPRILKVASHGNYL